MRKYAVLGAVLVAVAACQDSTSPRPIAVTPARSNAAQSAAPNDYIVTFRDDESDPEGQANALVKAYGGSVMFVYRSALKGFAVSNLPDAAVEALQRNPRITRVERDGIMTAVGSGTQSGATWGIDRIDQRTLPLNGTYAWEGDGSGVTAYIIDTGIRTSHVEFGGRATGGFTSINDGNGSNDCNGHGTHFAGTVGGATWGVAKQVALVAVRVLNCAGSGTTSGVVAGIDWVTANHAPNAVANMSLGGGASSTLDNAVANSVAAGVTYAVAAGNDNADACNSSPARAPAALTVGATTSGDVKASFSNYGLCVDINAPGVGITSAWNTSNTATNTISGTSMATPHVTGAAASYLSLNSGASPTQVGNALKSVASTGHLTGLNAGTPNLLLFVGFSSGPESGGGGGGGGGGDPKPVAGLSKSCSGFTCTFTSTSTGATSYKWTFVNGNLSSPQTGPGPYSVTYQKRQSGSVTLEVTNAAGSSTTSLTVSCNPVKCQ
jgi:subtilisin family serine protease